MIVETLNFDSFHVIGSSAVAIGKKIFVVGGFEKSPRSPSLNLWSFDKNKAKWSSICINSAGFANRAFHSAAVMSSSKAFIFGGCLTSGCDVSVPFSADLRSIIASPDIISLKHTAYGVNLSVVLSDPRLALVGHSTCTVGRLGEFAITFGGVHIQPTSSSDSSTTTSNSAKAFKSDILLFRERNISLDSVEFEGAELPQPRAYHSATVCGDSSEYIVITGGRNDTTVFNDVWLLDLTDVLKAEADALNADKAAPDDPKAKKATAGGGSAKKGGGKGDKNASGKPTAKWYKLIDGDNVIRRYMHLSFTYVSRDSLDPSETRVKIFGGFSNLGELPEKGCAPQDLSFIKSADGRFVGSLVDVQQQDGQYQFGDDDQFASLPTSSSTGVYTGSFVGSCLVPVYEESAGLPDSVDVKFNVPDTTLAARGGASSPNSRVDTARLVGIEGFKSPAAVLIFGGNRGPSSLLDTTAEDDDHDYTSKYLVIVPDSPALLALQKAIENENPQIARSRSRKKMGPNVIHYPNGDVYTGDVIQRREEEEEEREVVSTRDDAQKLGGNNNNEEEEEERGDGVVSDPVPHGYGKMEYTNGMEIYEGDWVQGIRHGSGKHTVKLLYVPDSPGGGAAADFAFSSSYNHDGGGDDGSQIVSEYDGEFQNDRRNGHGSLRELSGMSYEGEFFDDNFNGYGRLVHSNGDVYEGMFMDGLKHGKGTLLFKDTGATYDGEWVNDNMTVGIAKAYAIYSGGQMRPSSPRAPATRPPTSPATIRLLRLPGGSAKGTYNDDQTSSYGFSATTGGDAVGESKQEGGDHADNSNNDNSNAVWEVADEKTENSGIYDGQIIDGLPNSTNGVCRYSDGSQYNGAWRNGRRNGLGTLVTSAGGEYTGKWVGDKKCGKGLWRTIRGETYEGLWDKNLPNGHGVRVYPDGSTYKGAWVDGKRQGGDGRMDYTDGSIYEGSWKYDLRSGASGKWTRGKFSKEHADGQLTYEGEWLNDQRCGKGVSTYEDGSVFEGLFEEDKPVSLAFASTKK